MNYRHSPEPQKNKVPGGRQTTSGVTKQTWECADSSRTHHSHTKRKKDRHKHTHSQPEFTPVRRLYECGVLPTVLSPDSLFSLSFMPVLFLVYWCCFLQYNSISLPPSHTHADAHTHKHTHGNGKERS